MSPTHSPGPWEAFESEINPGVWYVGNDFFALLRTDSSSHPEADARLAALAPDLVEALDALLTEAEDVFVCMADATGIDRHNFPAPFIAARAALSKARPSNSGEA